MCVCGRMDLDTPLSLLPPFLPNRSTRTPSPQPAGGAGTRGRRSAASAGHGLAWPSLVFRIMIKHFCEPEPSLHPSLPAPASFLHPLSRSTQLAHSYWLKAGRGGGGGREGRDKASLSPADAGVVSPPRPPRRPRSRGRSDAGTLRSVAKRRRRPERPHQPGVGQQRCGRRRQCPCQAGRGEETRAASAPACWPAWQLSAPACVPPTMGVASHFRAGGRRKMRRAMGAPRSPPRPTARGQHGRGGWRGEVDDPARNV